MSASNLAFVCLVVVVVTAVTGQSRYTNDIKAEYYATVSMQCEHPQLNITEQSNVRSMSWMFPDGTTKYSNNDLDQDLFQFSGPEDGGTGPNFEAYNLTAILIDHDVFGYYICIVVYDTPDMPISVIRWGLNVDGADFSALIETYKDGAIVGGVAAAIFFVLVVGTCIVWHYFFSDRRDAIGEEEEDVDEMLEKKHHTYTNQGYNPSVDASQVEVKVDEPNGYNTKM